MVYNKPTLRIAVRFLCSIALLGLVGLLVVSRSQPPPRRVSPSSFEVLAFRAPGTTAAKRAPIATRVPSKLDERFVVTWPNMLKVAVPEVVIVRIAANDYEDLLTGLGADRRRKIQDFKGYARLEVTLKSDAGIEVVSQHSDVQIVERGRRHREWSWSVWPRSTGRHQLSLLVQGINGKDREDYDPEVQEYDVVFNPWNWLSTGIQQNGITWGWAVILLLVSNWITLLISRSRGRERPKSD